MIATWLMGVATQFQRLGIDISAPEFGLTATARGLTAPTRQLQLVQVRRVWQRAVAASGDPLLGDTRGLGATAAYYRSITSKLSATAAVGVDGVTRENMVDIWSAQALVGVRYSF